MTLDSLAAAAGWLAPAATMLAALMTAANLGARVTGWGFVVFTLGALAWIAVAWTSGQQNLLLSNLFLLAVDLFGIWRWLGRRARYADGAAAAAAESAADAGAPGLFAVGTLEGRTVYGVDGSAIAVTVDAMLGCRDGRLAYLVVSAGGLGGVGERLHALGWHEVRMSGEGVHTRLDPERLAARPQLQPNAWPASAEAAGAR